MGSVSSSKVSDYIESDDDENTDSKKEMIFVENKLKLHPFCKHQINKISNQQGKSLELEKMRKTYTSPQLLKDLFKEAVDPIPFKMIIVPIDGNLFTKKLCHIMSNRDQLGYVHVALQLGGKILDWNDSSLVIPRPWKSSAMAALDLRSATTQHISKTDAFLDKVCAVISKWNRTKIYSRISANCQHFVEDMLFALDIKPFWNWPIQRYLDDIRNNIEHTKPHIWITEKGEEKLITFDSHDHLHNWMIQSKEAVGDRKFEEYLPLVKAFDRGFWLQEMISKDPDSGHTTSCPFGDPSINQGKDSPNILSNVDENATFLDLLSDNGDK